MLCFISVILVNIWQHNEGSKIYELVLFKKIFVQLFWNLFGSFFLVFPAWILCSNRFKNEISLNLENNSKAYLEPCQTLKVEVLSKIVSDLYFLYIFANSSILDVWQDSEFASEASNALQRKLHLNCLTGFWIRLCSNYFCKSAGYLFTNFD